MSLTALAFLALYAGGLLAALTRGPIWGLLTYVLTLYLHPPGRWWGAGLPGLRWSLVIAVITLVAYWLHKNKRNPNGSFFRQGPVIALVMLTLWMGIQTTWAVWPNEQLELFVLYVKYLVLMYLIFRIIDTPEKLKLFLWTHVAGCFVMGWNAFQTYTGGRFEGFVPPNLNEANSGGLALVTGMAAAGALFLASPWRQRLLLLAMGMFIANGIVTTESRSAFLAAGVAALAFNWFVPKRSRGQVRLWTVVAIAGFLALTNPFYWQRISTIKQAGEQVEGVNTGYGRVVLLQAQWRMFLANPLGHGHRGTAFLSRYYLEDRYLTGQGEHRGRASHNTFMTLLVEQGIVGAAIYLYLLLWLWRAARRTYCELRDQPGFMPLAFTATVAILAAIFVGDMFVDYLKIEARLWFMTILMALPALYRAGNAALRAQRPGPVPAAGPARPEPPALTEPTAATKSTSAKPLR